MQDRKYQLISSAQQYATINNILISNRAIGIQIIPTNANIFQSTIGIIQLITQNASYFLDINADTTLIKAIGQLLVAEKPTKVFHNAKLPLKLIERHFLVGAFH